MVTHETAKGELIGSPSPALHALEGILTPHSARGPAHLETLEYVMLALALSHYIRVNLHPLPPSAANLPVFTEHHTITTVEGYNCASNI